MTTTNKFKETDIGNIPVEWDIEEIGDLYSSQYGYTESAKDEDTGTKFLRITDISENGQVKWNTVPYCEIEEKDLEKFKLETGDLLVARIGATTGKTCLINTDVEQSVFASYLIRLQRKNEKIIPSFGFYFTQSKLYWDQINANKGGKLKKGVSATLLKTLKVPVPDNTEQKAIAQKLTVIRNAIEQTQAVIEATEALKKSMMKHLFTYGPVPANQTDQVKLKETEIGLVPEEWRMAKLGKFVDVKGGYAFKSKDYSEDGIRVLRISNVSFGFADWEDVQYLPNDFLEKNSDYGLKTGDLVMAMTRPVVSGGIKVAKLKERDVPSLLNQRVCKFEPSNEINTDYLFQIIFNKSFIEAVSLGAIGSHQPNISATQIKNIKIPIPDIDLQKKIAKQLNKIDEKLSAERDKKSTLESLFNSTLESLMSAKIRVN